MAACHSHVFDFINPACIPNIPEPPTDFTVSPKLDIGRIDYDAPNFVSNGATKDNLAKALEREFENFSFMEDVEYADLTPPEMEINMQAMTIKSEATDEEGLARDTVAEIRRELVKNANLFAQSHLMNYEKTGELPQ